MAGNCPYCETPLAEVNLDPIRVNILGANPLRGLSYACPFCLKIIGVGIDPVALKEDIVDEVLEGMEK